MNPDPHKAEELFDRALLFEPGERAAFLAGACGNDVHLRRRVEDLLMASEAQSGFLPDEQPTESTATLLDESMYTEGSGTQIGRYKLLEKLGEGGFGSVWAAEQKEPVRRRVALKIIKLGMDTKQVVARFEAERQALALMDHPNIAKVLDAGATETGRPYFVMELVKGVAITKYCEREKLPTRKRLDLFIKVCQAIQHAHQKGIIHRDIKPSNIMVTLHDGVPVPKVIDFGIAKATQQELTEKTIYTQYSQFIGTPAYMSPEQAEMSGLDIDTRSDIYSLGVLLYELLTGKTPFDAKALMQSGIDEMRRIIREQEPVRPSTRLSQTLAGDDLKNLDTGVPKTTDEARASSRRLLQELKGDLDWIVMKCLEKDRQRRYDTANALAMDLTRHLNNEPVTACPPTTAYKFQKAFRRNKLMFTASAAVVAALVAGLAISLWQYAGKSRAELEQVRLRERAEAKALEASEARALASQQRDLANERLYDSLVREARSIRKTRQVGYQREVFDRIRQAAAIKVESRDLGLLRREAAASFGDWVGLDPVDIDVAGGTDIGCLTADGALAAIAHANDRAVSLHETDTGREVARLDVGGVLTSSMAFDREGTTLYVAISADPASEIRHSTIFRLEKWSLQGDANWKRVWSRNEDHMTQVVATDEGPVSIETVGQQEAFLLTDIERQVELARVLLDKPPCIFPNATISPDRRKFAFFTMETTNSFDAQVELRDLSDGRRLTAPTPHQGAGFGLSFNESGQTLATSFAGKVIVYETGQLSANFGFQGIFDNNWGASQAGSTGLMAIPAIQELAVRLVQAQSGRELAFLNLPGIPLMQCFSSDGEVLLVTHTRGARIIHLKADREKQLLEGHQGGVPAMVFTPDGRELISTGKDRTLRHWDLIDGRSRILGSLPAPGQTLSLTPDGSVLACGYYDISELSLWSLPAGKQLGQLSQSSDQRGTTWNCAFSPDGKLLAAAGSGLRVWDTTALLQNTIESAASVSLLISETNGYSSVAFDPAGGQLAYQAFDPNVNSGTSPAIFLRSLDSGARPEVIATNIQMNPVQPLCFLPESGRLAYVAAGRREITMLEPGTWKASSELNTLMPGENTTWYVANLTASPDESRLAMVTPSGLGVDLRDTISGRPLFSLPEEPSTIWWLTWSPDSQRLAVSRANGEIAIWNLKEVEQQLAALGLMP